MEVVITDVAGVTKAQLTGRLDTVNVDKVETSFTSGIVPKAQHTIIDMTEVTFIASLGIRMLLSSARVLGRRGAKFALFGANAAVMEIIETVALSDIIPVFGTEAEAIASVNG